MANQPKTRQTNIDAELDRQAEQYVDPSLRGPGFVARRWNWIVRDWLRSRGVRPADNGAERQEGDAADGAASAPATEAT